MPDLNNPRQYGSLTVVIAYAEAPNGAGSKLLAPIIIVGLLASGYWFMTGGPMPSLTEPATALEQVRDHLTLDNYTAQEAAREGNPAARHSQLKQTMLQLTNQERQKEGVPPVTLGTNPAPQIHAEEALRGCYSSHWDRWGLKPNHRYTITGGTGSDSENVSGNDYCIRAEDGYSPNRGMKNQISETIEGWMESPGHRRNLLDPSHSVLNVGIAFDHYNTVMVQHFSSHYLQYAVEPHIDPHGVLRLQADIKGASLDIGDSANLTISYDPPPKELTRGQLSHTYALCNGRKIGYVVRPLTGGRFYTDPESRIEEQNMNCVDPYSTPPGRQAPNSNKEADEAWEKAKAESSQERKVTTRVTRMTADTFSSSADHMVLVADLSQLLQDEGPGIYTIILWGKPHHMAKTVPLSEQAIFWQTEPTPGNPYFHHKEPPSMDAEAETNKTAPPIVQAVPQAKEQGVAKPNLTINPTSEPQPVNTAAASAHPTLPPLTRQTAPTVAPPPTYTVLTINPTLMPAVPAATISSTPLYQAVRVGTLPTPQPVGAQAPQIPTTVLQPTPTPLPVTQTYSSPTEGYSIQHPFAWKVSQEGQTTLIRANDQSASLIVKKTSVTRDQSLGDIADAYMRSQLVQAPSWAHYSSKWAAGGTNNSGPYLKLEFTKQETPSDCRESGETHIFRSREFPREMSGYSVTMTACSGRTPPEELFGYLATFHQD